MRDIVISTRNRTAKTVVAAITGIALLQGLASAVSAEAAKAKVAGEKRTRKLGDKPFFSNFALGPVAPVLKGFQSAAFVRASKSFSHGLKSSWVNTSLDVGQSTWGYGNQYHLLGGDVMNDGPIVETALAVVLAHRSTPGGGSDMQKAVRLSTSLNWQWVHDSGFNIRVGGGLGGQHVFDGELEYLGTSGSVAIPISDLGTLHAFLDAKVAWAY